MSLRIHPDNLYQPGSQTFFYFPQGRLVVAPYPASHWDMINDDDELRDAVGMSDYKSSFGYRSEALRQGKAHLGRLGMANGTVTIAFWNPPKREDLNKFFAVLFAKYPGLKEFQDKMNVVLSPGQDAEGEKTGGAPIPFLTLVDQPLAATSPERKISLPSQASGKDSDQFNIGGRVYSLADLRGFRARLHTAGGVPHPALCHPDVEKYPALRGFRPSSCPSDDPPPLSGRQQWRAAAREKGHPYAFSYGEFANWVAFQDIFRETPYVAST